VLVPLLARDGKEELRLDMRKSNCNIYHYLPHRATQGRVTERLP
jgi:hypothetical protein